MRSPDLSHEGRNKFQLFSKKSSQYSTKLRGTYRFDTLVYMSFPSRKILLAPCVSGGKCALKRRPRPVSSRGLPPEPLNLPLTPCSALKLNHAHGHNRYHPKSATGKLLSHLRPVFWWFPFLFSCCCTTQESRIRLSNPDYCTSKRCHQHQDATRVWRREFICSIKLTE